MKSSDYELNKRPSLLCKALDIFDNKMQSLPVMPPEMQLPTPNAIFGFEDFCAYCLFISSNTILRINDYPRVSVL